MCVRVLSHRGAIDVFPSPISCVGQISSFIFLLCRSKLCRHCFTALLNSVQAAVLQWRFAIARKALWTSTCCLKTYLLLRQRDRQHCEHEEWKMPPHRSEHNWTRNYFIRFPSWGTTCWVLSPMTAKHTQTLGDRRKQEKARGGSGERLDQARLVCIEKNRGGSGPFVWLCMMLTFWRQICYHSFMNLH